MNKTDKILSSIAHEYISPLSHITMETEMVSKMCSCNDMDAENIIKRMELIRRNCKRLQYITSLALGSIPEKDFRLNCCIENIEEFFGTLIESTNLYYSDSNVKITFKSMLSDNEYCCDYGLLEQITMNLVTNAIKYNNKKTKRIAITAKENKVSAIFEFKDNGIGIEEKHYNKIFDSYYRANDSAYDGLGLGLYNVKKYVELMNGKITVTSEKGQGSTFTVTLPKNIPPSPGFKEITKSYFLKSTMEMYGTAFEK